MTPPVSVPEPAKALRDVLDWVMAREMAPRGKFRCTGRSSDAFTNWACGYEVEPDVSHYPLDRGDLDACERTYLMAPYWLRPKMLPVLEKYRAFVAERVAKWEQARV